LPFFQQYHRVRLDALGQPDVRADDGVMTDNDVAAEYRCVGIELIVERCASAGKENALD
jgi:hypothetical protein